MNSLNEVKKIIESGKAVLGIELGSTRIKAVLVDQMGSVIETGGFDWENSLIDGAWTYSLDEVWTGIQECYKDLSERVKEKYDVRINKLSAMGVSAMMHGYLPFDKDGNQLAEFRTWRNTFTGQAANELTELFQYNIPERWSIAHLYHAILNNDATNEVIYYDYDNELLTAQESDALYVGVMASRGVQVTVSDMELTLISPEDDEEEGKL